MANDNPAIATFVTAMNAFMDRQDKAVADIQTEMDQLNAEITAFNNSPGTLSTTDQAAVDAIQARASALSDKIDAMDKLTPPAPPPVVPAP